MRVQHASFLGTFSLVVVATIIHDVRGNEVPQKMKLGRRLRGGMTAHKANTYGINEPRRLYVIDPDPTYVHDEEEEMGGADPVDPTLVEDPLLIAEDENQFITEEQEAAAEQAAAEKAMQAEEAAMIAAEEAALAEQAAKEAREAAIEAEAAAAVVMEQVEGEMNTAHAELPVLDPDATEVVNADASIPDMDPLSHSEGQLEEAMALVEHAITPAEKEKGMQLLDEAEGAILEATQDIEKAEGLLENEQPSPEEQDLEVPPMPDGSEIGFVDSVESQVADPAHPPGRGVGDDVMDESPVVPDTDPLSQAEGQLDEAMVLVGHAVTPDEKEKGMQLLEEAEEAILEATQEIEKAEGLLEEVPPMMDGSEIGFAGGGAPDVMAISPMQDVSEMGDSQFAAPSHPDEEVEDEIYDSMANEEGYDPLLVEEEIMAYEAEDMAKDIDQSEIDTMEEENAVHEEQEDDVEFAKNEEAVEATMNGEEIVEPTSGNTGIDDSLMPDNPDAEMETEAMTENEEWEEGTAMDETGGRS